MHITKGWSVGEALDLISRVAFFESVGTSDKIRFPVVYFSPSRQILGQCPDYVLVSFIEIPSNLSFAYHIFETG